MYQTELAGEGRVKQLQLLSVIGPQTRGRPVSDLTTVTVIVSASHFDVCEGTNDVLGYLVILPIAGADVGGSVA